MAPEGTVAADRISDLPDLVLHHIMSFLTVKDAARTSILSNRWNSMWETLPYLNFADALTSLHPRGDEGLRKNRLLLDVAERLILRRRQQNIRIEKLSLAIPKHELSTEQMLRISCGDSPLSFELDRWMSYIASSSLRELNLISRVHVFHYLPSRILSARSLTVLSLYGFSLRSLLSLEIKFYSLQKLSLGKVDLDDEIMQNLIMGCPSLETLQLRHCYGLSSIYVTGLTKLKLLELDCLSQLKMLEIDAPELVVLSVFDPSSECLFNVKSCSHLRELKLRGLFITDGTQLHQLVSQSFFLERLIITSSTKLKHIKISSDSLKTLKLRALGNLEEVEISTPALEKFTFEPKKLPTILLNVSEMLEVELHLVHLEHDEQAKFLRYFNNIRTVTLSGPSDKVIIPKDKRENLLSRLCGTGNMAFYLSEETREKFVAVELVDYLLRLAATSRVCVNNMNEN